MRGAGDLLDGYGEAQGSPRLTGVVERHRKPGTSESDNPLTWMDPDERPRHLRSTEVAPRSAACHEADSEQ
jgi:hypothetical protein